MKFQKLFVMTGEHFSKFMFRFTFNIVIANFNINL